MKNQKFSIWKYLKKHTFGVIMYVLLYLIASACTVVITIFAAQSIQYLTDKIWDQAIYTMLGVLGAVAMQQVCYWVLNVLYDKIQASFMLAVNSDLAVRAFKLSSETYANHDSGTFVQRIIEDPGSIFERLSDIINVMSSLLSAIIVFLYIASLNIWLFLLLVALIGVCVVIEIFRFLYRKSHRMEARRKRDKAYSLTNEIVRSEKDIKSMGLEDKLSEESRECYRDYHKTYCRNEVADANFFSLRNILLQCGVYAILVLGIVFVKKDFIALATFMIIYSNRDNLFGIVWQFANLGNIITDVKISAKRIGALFDEDEFQTEKFGDISLPKTDGGAKITFNHVQYSYVSKEYDSKYSKKKSKDEKNQPIVTTNKVFDDLSFNIKPNTTVAFVGKSGSEKSTILNLMSKLYVADGGEILINDVNINDLTKESLRSSISLVNQFPYIFNMSIRENLLLAKKDATDDDLLKALQDADLKEFVLGLPKGLETVVGEGGIKLSGGQRQRLAIARALLRNSNVIIFDESTSSLDNFSQEEIKKSIDALKGKSTIVIVAHRLSTIKNVDHIFFLDGGKIIDEGTFNQLFKKNQTFKTMFMAENL